MSEHEASSLVECVARVLGVASLDVPGDGSVGLRQWLAQRNLGLVPVEFPERFAWPGHFLGRRRDSRTWAVYFGVPPGVVFDDLIGKRFRVGEIECFGRRRCEPWARPGVLRGLVHRGGLRRPTLGW